MANISVYGVNISSMPNPTAVEAWYEADVADRLAQYKCIMAGATSIILWDTFMSLLEDLKLVFGFTFTFQTLAFVLARSGAISFCVIGVIGALWDGVGDCETILLASSAAYTLAQCCTGLLFFFRVSAVWENKYSIVAVFALPWLALTTGAATTFFVLKPTRVGPTRSCQAEITGRYVVIASFTQMTFDLLVFIFITFRLGSRTCDTGRSPSWFMFSRRNLSRFTQRFLRDSQIYLATAAISKFCTIIVFFTFNGNKQASLIQIALAYPDTVVTCVVASKIYRNMRLDKPGIFQFPGYQTSDVVFSQLRGPVEDSPDGHSTDSPPICADEQLDLQDVRRGDGRRSQPVRSSNITLEARNKHPS